MRAAPILLAVGLACATPPPAKSPNDPVSARADLGPPPSSAQRKVVGAYVEVDTRMKQKPPPVHNGHAAVQLDDGTLVYLEPPWTREAIRPLDERRTLAGKRVEVSGLVHSTCPPPSQPMAHLVCACISPVDTLTVR